MYGNVVHGNPINRAHPLARGLVGFWLPTAYYASGPRLIDLSGFRRHGTFVGPPAWGGDGTDRAVNFTAATTQQVDLGAPLTTFLPSASACTALWSQKPSQAFNSSTIRHVWGFTQGGGQPEFSCQAYLDNQWYVGFASGGGDHRVVAGTTAANWTQDRRTNYALTCLSGGVSTFYAGASVVASNGGTTTFLTPSSNGAIGLHGGAVASVCFGGLVFCFALFNRAFSAAEVAAWDRLALRGFPGFLNRWSIPAVYAVAAAGGTAKPHHYYAMQRGA